MGIRTQASLEKLFEASRLRSLKRKQQEQLKYKKAQESIKKALAKQQSKEQEKTSQKPQKQPQIELSRTIHIYNIKYVERFADDEDLYQTREELMEAERRGEGKINWDRFNEIVEQTKQILNNGI
jgi:hypothetical protein